MRRRTRNVTIAILAIVALLLALGALPSLIKSGDPYYVTATPADGGGPAVNVTEYPASHYPFTMGAITDADGNATGYSSAYWKGYVGFKEAFTHSPFDEMDSLRGINASAADGDAVYVVDDGTRYRVALTQEGPQ
ncbi:hypothetical protein ACKVMT_08765 [Halobacteriales archaeon Cl-PHB]